MMMMVLLIYWFLLAADVHRTSAKCPSSCQCYVQSAVHSIFCVRASLSHVPNSFNFEVKILNFTGNAVPVLSDEFHNPYYKSLEILDLKHNGIEMVANAALHNLRNLLEIDLSGNEIGAINGKMWSKNRFLNTISLSGNPIREIKKNAFPALIYLKKLDLRACKLRKVHRSAFVNTPLLEQLNLQDNALKHLPVGVLHLSQLGLLLLDGNPWKCDESLWRALKWFQGKNSTFGGSLLCVYGETENAIFWDTMDVDSPHKFRNIRNKRAIVVTRVHEEPRNTGRIAVVKTAQYERTPAPPPKRDTISTSRIVLKDDDNCTQNNEYSPGKAYIPDQNATASNTSEKNKTGKKEKNASPTSPPSAFKINSQTWPVRYNNAKIVRNFVEQPRKYEETQKSRDETARWYLRQFNKNIVKTHADIPTTTRVFGQYGGNFQQIYNERADADGEARSLPGGAAAAAAAAAAASANRQFQVSIYDISNRTTTEEYNDGKQYQHSYSDNDSLMEEEEADLFEENHKIVLMAELILIVILLLVLYKLWNEGRKRNEPAGANVPLNNAGKKTKSYDSQLSGYKRYSLSDEDYSHIRDHCDEGKYDTESGYLSYHRYNSVEGENDEYALHGRRYNATDDHNGSDFENVDAKTKTKTKTLPFANRNFQPCHQLDGATDFATNTATLTLSRHDSTSGRSSHDQHSVKKNVSRSSTIDDGKHHFDDRDNNN